MPPTPSADMHMGTPKVMISQDAMLTPPGPSGSPQQTPPGSGGVIKPTKEEAKRALETLLGFLRQDSLGFELNNEYNVVQGLLNRLNMDDDKRSGTPVGGGFLAMMEGTEPALSGI